MKNEMTTEGEIIESLARQNAQMEILIAIKSRKFETLDDLKDHLESLMTGNRKINSKNY
ncbi:MAG: hypothetical protein FWE20_05720 [Defluviitaleaceae bacterium]|nr:hypothetical protein [Defluviitaleaceae bacterium]